MLKSALMVVASILFSLFAVACDEQGNVDPAAVQSTISAMQTAGIPTPTATIAITGTQIGQYLDIEQLFCGRIPSRIDQFGQVSKEQLVRMSIMGRVLGKYPRIHLVPLLKDQDGRIVSDNIARQDGVVSYPAGSALLKMPISKEVPNAQMVSGTPVTKYTLSKSSQDLQTEDVQRARFCSIEFWDDESGKLIGRLTSPITQ